MPKIQWHPGFCGGMELRLREYRDILEFKHEQEISKLPIRADTIIIRKKDSRRIEEDVASIFLGHNIIEYKSPGDQMSIDDYYNLLSYMTRYKATTGRTDAIKADDVTGTLMRDAKPVKLMRNIEALGGDVQMVYPGIYYVTGLIHMPTQIIVQSELANPNNAVLRVLTDRGRDEDLTMFAEQAALLTDKRDRENVDVVLEASVAANRARYEELRRRDPAMCEAMRDLMRDELEERERVGRAEGQLEGRSEGRVQGTMELLVSLVREGLLSKDEALRRLEVPQSMFEEALAKA